MLRASRLGSREARTAPDAARCAIASTSAGLGAGGSHATAARRTRRAQRANDPLPTVGTLASRIAAPPLATIRGRPRYGSSGEGHRPQANVEYAITSREAVDVRQSASRPGPSRSMRTIGAAPSAPLTARANRLPCIEPTTCTSRGSRCGRGVGTGWDRVRRTVWDTELGTAPFTVRTNLAVHAQTWRRARRTTVLSSLAGTSRPYPWALPPRHANGEPNRLSSVSCRCSSGDGPSRLLMLMATREVLRWSRYRQPPE